MLEGLPASMHVVVAARHLAEMTNVLAEYQIRHGMRTITKRRPIFEDAMAIARERFAEAGALLPVILDESGTLVQVYPKELKVAVIVMRPIAGKEHFVVRDYDLPKPAIDALLNAAGKKLTQH